jgi:hypothetical protein
MSNIGSYVMWFSLVTGAAIDAVVHCWAIQYLTARALPIRMPAGEVAGSITSSFVPTRRILRRLVWLVTFVVDAVHHSFPRLRSSSGI